MPKVSIIIPLDNRSEYLRVTIASVLDQTFRDLKAIVVDDASKDDTLDVVRSFGNPLLKYLRHNVNKGANNRICGNPKIIPHVRTFFLRDQR